jgi:hypothetical protein
MSTYLADPQSQSPVAETGGMAAHNLGFPPVHTTGGPWSLTWENWEPVLSTGPTIHRVTLLARLLVTVFMTVLSIHRTHASTRLAYGSAVIPGTLEVISFFSFSLIYSVLHNGIETLVNVFV